MKIKRFLVLLLTFCLIVGHFSFIHAKAASSEDVWVQIGQVEEEVYSPKRGQNTIDEAIKAYSAAVDQIIAVVENSGNYQEDSLEQHGAFFYWKDASGMTNCYSPSVRAKIKLNGTGTTYSDIITWTDEEQESDETKANKPSTLAVGIVQPFYGIDSHFTEGYFNTAKQIAKKTGGSCAAYRGSAVTIDIIAALLRTCGVVIFDSHGGTDYQNPSDSDDTTSQANTSYLVINSDVGLENELYATSHQGIYGTYYDVCSGGYDDAGNHVMFINGNAIANHMSSNAPSSLVWMGMCLGMATDGLYKALRTKGVEVVCGYSQSVTFAADYAWKDAFFEKLMAGGTVKTASAYMKQQVGYYDPYVSKYPAYPIVVSSVDPYPGRGSVDAVQTVTSAWKLATTTTAAPAIKMQPQSQTVSVGDPVDFSVVVAGTPTKYQWQVYKGSSWANISTTSFPSAKTSVLSFTTKATMYGYKYRCKITFSDGTTLTSKAATLSFTPGILQQPEQTPVLNPGDTAKFTVKVAGEVESYRWMVCKDFQNWVYINTEKYPSAATATLKFKVSKAMGWYCYSCVITMKDGTQFVSHAAYLLVYGTVAGAFDATCVEGETATFIAYAHKIQSCQWQVSKNGGKTWSNIDTTKYPSAATNCLEFDAKGSMDGYQYRCKLVFDDGKTAVTSGAGTLTVYGVSKQPSSTTVTAGKSATFTVTATYPGEVYRYRWQVSKDGGKTWSYINTETYPSAATNTLTFKAKSTMNGYYYRCVIEMWSSYTLVYTNKAKLTVK